MKSYTPTEQKTKLQGAIKSALKVANEEMIVLGPHYAEENLRYVVMTAISDVKCFGVFPNKNDDGFNLCFEKHYEKNIFKPDIVSINLRANGKNRKVNKINPLVIELKINALITATDNKKKINSKLPKDIQKIKKMGSCLSTDIYKVRQYLKRVDNTQFNFGVVMNIGIPKPPKREREKNDFINYTFDLEAVLNKHQKEFRKESNTSRNLLFAWFNPLTNKPELIWLNQDDPIKLGGI
jgi:hypothetical protein